MAAYSPISSRHTSCAPNQASRRPRVDSISSSIGATSVRRLLAVVRTAQPSAHRPASHSARPALLLVNLLVLCLSHLLVTGPHLSYLVLQSSVGAWWAPWPNQGALLPALAYLWGAWAALLAPGVVRIAGANCALGFATASLGAFHLAHLAPSTYVLVPGGVLAGTALGLLAGGQTAALRTLAVKMGGCVGDECEEEVTSRSSARRACAVRRMARAFRAAHDFGLIIGSAVTAAVVTYTMDGGGGGQWANGTSANGSDCWNCRYLLDHSTRPFDLVKREVSR